MQARVKRAAVQLIIVHTVICATMHSIIIPGQRVCLMLEILGALQRIIVGGQIEGAILGQSDKLSV